MRRVHLTQFLIERQRDKKLINASSTFIPLASGALSVLAGSMSPAFWLLAASLLAGAWFARRRIG